MENIKNLKALCTGFSVGGSSSNDNTDEQPSALCTGPLALVITLILSTAMAMSLLIATNLLVVYLII